MTALLPFKVRRFIATAFFAAVAAGSFVLLVCLFPDTRPLTAFEHFCVCVAAVVSWPFDIFAVFHPDSDPSLVVSILLSIASGLFWALCVELFFVVKRRRAA
jgi:hypothetical protein